MKLSIMQTAVGLPRLAAFLASGVHLDDVTRQCGQVSGMHPVLLVESVMSTAACHIECCAMQSGAVQILPGAPLLL